MQSFIYYSASFLMFLFALITFGVSLCIALDYERCNSGGRGYALGYLCGVSSSVFAATIYYMVVSGAIFS